MRPTADKIPLTYMRVFHAAAELRWQMSSTDWPVDDSICEVISSFNNVYRDSAHGTRVVDVLSTIPSFPTTTFMDLYARLTDSRLDAASYSSLVELLNHTCTTTSFTTFLSSIEDHRTRLSPLARFVPKLEISGLIWGTRSSNIRNSFICFRDPLSSDSSLVHSGQISAIFLHSYTDPLSKKQVVAPYLVVDQFAELSPQHAQNDPYRVYPLLDTKLCYNRFAGEATLIRPTDIIAHFAALVYEPEGINESCIVVRSLDRVRTQPSCVKLV